MIQNRSRNIGASVRQRLLNLAREKSEAFDLVLTRYALERLLYRIGQSEWRLRFLLKGAMLYTLWYDAPYRPTRDMDLLAFGQSDIAHLIEAFRTLCDVTVEDDGIEFLKESVRGSEIRGESEYQGVRIQMTATLAGAVIPLQVDVALVMLLCRLLKRFAIPPFLISHHPRSWPTPDTRLFPRSSRPW